MWGIPQDKIHFYVDATTGQAFSHKDVENYFKRISVPPTPSYFKPQSHKRIIQVSAGRSGQMFRQAIE
jgi:hypothetical protein